MGIVLSIEILTDRFYLENRVLSLCGDDANISLFLFNVNPSILPTQASKFTFHIFF